MKVMTIIVLVASLFAGCVAVDLQSSASKDVGSKKSFEFFQNSYTKEWCGQSPQEVLDSQLQPSADVDIREAGLYRVTVSQTSGQIMRGILFLGFRTPVYVTWWLEK